MDTVNVARALAEQVKNCETQPFEPAKIDINNCKIARPADLRPLTEAEYQAIPFEPREKYQRFAYSVSIKFNGQELSGGGCTHEDGLERILLDLWEQRVRARIKREAEGR